MTFIKGLVEEAWEEIVTGRIIWSSFRFVGGVAVTITVVYVLKWILEG